MTQSPTTEQVVRKLPYGAPHVLVLCVIDGEDLAAVHRIASPETVLGRGGDADFVVEDDEVSKQHCVIRVDGPVSMLADLGSLNGTWLNGRRVRPEVPQRLRHLDEILIGSTRLFLLIGKFKQPPKGP